MTPAEQDRLIAANERLRKALEAMPIEWLRSGVLSMDDPEHRVDGVAIKMHIVGTTYEAEMTVGDLRAIAAALSEPNEQTTEDGWIEWKGGECPVADALMVRCTLRNGDADTGRAGNLDWSHYGPGLADGDYDITAYRPVSP